MRRGHSHVTARPSDSPVRNALATPAFSPAYPAKPLGTDYCHPEVHPELVEGSFSGSTDQIGTHVTIQPSSTMPRLSVTRLQMQNTVVGLPGHSFPWDLETSEQHPEQSFSPNTTRRVDRLPVTTEQAVTRPKRTAEAKTCHSNPSLDSQRPIEANKSAELR